MTADDKPPLILDASVLLEGMGLPPNERCMVPPSVVDEVRKGRPGQAMEGMLAAGLEMREPAPESVGKVREAAGATGDDARLSVADAECVALALETGGTLVTDDYSMQNTAARLGVAWRGVMQKGISRELEWQWRCRGCGRRFGRGEVRGGGDCPICGSDLRQVSRR
jgi:UPF0271 protein